MCYQTFTVYVDLHLFWHAVYMFPFDSENDGDNNDDNDRSHDDDGLKF